MLHILLSMVTFAHTQPTRIILILMVCLVTAGTLSGCATSQASTSFKVNQIYDVSRQERIAFEDLVPRLVAADVIFIGEEHYTPSHLEAAQKILKALLAHGRQPALAMEMFSWDGQEGLDRFIRETGITIDQLIADSQWKNNWGGEFSHYQGLITFAKSHQLRIIALNPPRPLVRLVATKGLFAASEDPEMNKWPMGDMVTDDPDYEKVIFEQIEACHPGLPDHVYRRIFEASIFRDEGMAEVIANYLKEKSPEAGPLVSYTGGGHIQYKVPVPKRVARKHPGAKSVTIYLETWDPSKKEDVLAGMNGNIADFLWLTPLGPQGLQERCG